jgi:hypothetical protein
MPARPDWHLLKPNGAHGLGGKVAAGPRSGWQMPPNRRRWLGDSAALDAPAVSRD